MDFGRLGNPSPLNDLLFPTAPAYFWTWGVVILAAVTSALAATVIWVLLFKPKVFIFPRRRTLVRLPSFCYSVEDDDDASISSDSSDEDNEEETDEMEERDRKEEDESGDFRLTKINGLGNFSFSSFSLADLVGGMGVVKAWDGIGLGLNRSGGETIRSFESVAARTTGLDLAWPAEIVSAANEASGAVIRVWDVRAGDKMPAATARPLLRRRITGVKALERKVFVRDDSGNIAAVDLRSLALV